ncbi:hypothetical protein C6495_14970 [Candidatus Poribacteria bacterium]|nr:MAG: hypothetical protein C6495_14970 [Candidatus Poribacteria bacterium]
MATKMLYADILQDHNWLLQEGSYELRILTPAQFTEAMKAAEQSGELEQEVDIAERVMAITGEHFDVKGFTSLKLGDVLLIACPQSPVQALQRAQVNPLERKRQEEREGALASVGKNHLFFSLTYSAGIVH